MTNAPKVVDKELYFQKIGYEPHPKQWLFHRSKARFRVACCGRRFGKSHMAARDLEPELLVPDRRFWIVGPTYDLAEKEFRVIWDDMIVGLGIGRDKSVKRAFNKRSGEMFIEFPWGTRVECRSADHPENLVGEKLDGVIMSEAAKLKRGVWERFISPALADRRGFATFCTTPEGYNWLYDEWAYGQNPNFPDYESWQFPSWENPYVYPEGRHDPEIRRIESTTIEAWFLQEIAASFSAFVGKIYPEWQEVEHVRSVKYNPEWPNYIAFDFGYVNPLAAIEFQVSPDDTVYVWREHYKSYLRMEEHIQQLKQRDQPEGYKIDMTFGDAADPEAVATINYHFAPCLALPEAKQNWRQGVDLVKRFLQRRTPQDGSLWTPDTVHPMGLYVDHSCVNTIREFNNYRAPQIAGRLPRNPREDSQKWDDHSLDAIRYGLMHIFELGAVTHLSDVYDSSSFTDTPETGYFTSNMEF